MITFIKWFLIGYFFIGFFFASLGVIAVNSDHDVQLEIRKDGDPQKVPYSLSLIILFVMVSFGWPLLLAKAKIRRDG